MTTGCNCVAPFPYQPTRRGLAFIGLRGFGDTSAAGAVLATGKGASTGAAAGAATASIIGASAAAGSVVPVIGTVIGAVAGLLASGVLNKTDQEIANWNQAIAIYAGNAANVFNISDKYLVLAGLFDLQSSQIKGNIPIYKKYGRMGEQQFVTDMVNTICAAGQKGQISSTDTPQSIMDRIVQPWIDGFGFGPMADNNSGLIEDTILGMVAEYVGGQQTRWVARGGQYPFGGLPTFAQCYQQSQAVGAGGAPNVPIAPAGTYITPQTPGPMGTSYGAFKYDARNGWLLNGTSVGSPSDLLAIGISADGRVIALYNNLGTVVWPSGGGWWAPLTPPGSYKGVSDPGWITGKVFATAAPSTVSPAPAGAYITPQTPGPLGTSYGVFQYDATHGWLLNGSSVGSPSDLLAIGISADGRVIGLYNNLGTVVWPSSGGWWTPLTPPGSYQGVNDPGWITGKVGTAAAVQPVGSQGSPTTTAAPLTPPAIGAVLTAAPDPSTGQLLSLPAGAVYGGMSSGGAWVVSYPSGTNAGTYTISQGRLVPYAPAASATVQQGMPTSTAASTTVATTSSGQAVTSADIQSLVSQLQAQGATAQQAYSSALQTLQAQGVQSTPQVQQAVQQAVSSPGTTTQAAGFSGVEIIGGLGLLYLFFKSGGPLKARRQTRRR